jgi:hypothetical protein
MKDSTQVLIAVVGLVGSLGGAYITTGRTFDRRFEDLQNDIANAKATVVELTQDVSKLHQAFSTIQESSSLVGKQVVFVDANPSHRGSDIRSGVSNINVSGNETVITFSKPFKDARYLALASTTEGYVVLTENSATSIKLRSYSPGGQALQNAQIFFLGIGQ